jgi:superfamily II DNA or RNA helicase
MILRPYQEACRDAVLSDLTTHRAVAAVMATASGKTPTAIAIMQSLPGPALVLAHRGELLDQACEKMAAFGIEPELEKADAWASLAAPVVLGSVQSLRNGRLERFPVDHFRFIWIDECHHAPAMSYRNILERFPGAKVFGCTATLDRLDGEGYEDIFSKISYEISLSELIRKDWLSRIMVRTLPVTIDLRAVRRTAGDFNVGDLSEAIGQELEKAADQIVKNIADRNKALAFTPTINEARILSELCAQRGVSAEFVSGGCADRAEKIARFKDGDTKLLANCMVLTEGFDCPAIDTIVLLRPTQSRALLCQQIGRVTRLWPGKDFGLVLDFFWLTARHKLCAAADLDGVEKEVSDEPVGPGGPRKDLNSKLRDAGAREERYFDPLANEPIDPFNVDAWLASEHVFYDSYLRSAPTVKQLEYLTRVGLNPRLLKNRGLVNGVFDMLKLRRSRGLATVKQARFLKRHGHPNPWRVPFDLVNHELANLRSGWALHVVLQ